MDNMDEFERYLIHYGIPKRSGRYPYGSGNRPFQSVKQFADKIKKRKTDKEASEREAARKKHEENKEPVLRSGSASQVMAYKGELTNKELQDVVTRLNLEKRLSDLSAGEIKTNMDKIDKAMKQIKQMDEWAKIGTSAYNTIASVYNATEEGKKNPLKKIS